VAPASSALQAREAWSCPQCRPKAYNSFSFFLRAAIVCNLLFSDDYTDWT
jgi:hypothetical protein